MVMLAGYFDASGADKVQKVFGLAGYVAKVDKWVSFDTEWKKALIEFNLPYFHLTDFINGKDRYYRDMVERDKNRLLDRLLRVIRLHCTHPIGAFFSKQDHDKAHAKVVPKGQRVAYYSTAANLCLVGMSNMANRCKYQEPIELVLDRGDLDRGQFHQAYRRVERKPQFAELRKSFHLGGFDFKNKSEFTPLQAADMFAYTGCCWHPGAVAPLYASRLGKLLDNNLDVIFPDERQLERIIATAL